jgi:C_GCAxxG_C_C family probable redox protein
MATGFCSGMARTCNQCGAVSGGMLAINLLTGRSSPKESVDKNYTLIQEFLRTFKEKFGSTNCQELTGCDLGTEEGHSKFIDNDTIFQCYEYVEEAVRMLIDLI